MAGMCEACGERPAEIRVTDVARGRIEERMLCSVCAAQLGVDVGGSTDFTVSKLVAGMGESEQAQGTPAPEVSCPACGLTLTEFRGSGKLGCPDCYQAFAKDLTVLIRRLQGSLRHTGRGPGERTTQQAIQLELAALRNRLAEAVANEAYEEAARIRDRIRELKASATDLPEEDG